MTRGRGSPAESKNCEILLLPTADRRFDTKVKCPTGRASFWVKFPTVRSLTRVKCPGIARGGGMGGFGIDWYIMQRFQVVICINRCACVMQLFSELMWVPCKRLRPSRPLLILTISYSCSQSVTERPTEAPSFVFIFFQIRYYSFQYFLSLRKKGNCKERQGDFSRYYIFLFFA